jgi:hypothetical protein
MIPPMFLSWLEDFLAKQSYVTYDGDKIGICNVSHSQVSTSVIMSNFDKYSIIYLRLIMLIFPPIFHVRNKMSQLDLGP